MTIKEKLEKINATMGATFYITRLWDAIKYITDKDMNKNYGGNKELFYENADNYWQKIIYSICENRPDLSEPLQPTEEYGEVIDFLYDEITDA